MLNKSLHKLILLLLMLFCHLPSGQADVIVVSDIDDTIKVTDVRGSYTRIVRNYIKGQAYAHLINIYRDLLQSLEEKGEKVTFYYLTNGVKYMPLSLEDWLQSYMAPRGIIQQRGLFDLLSQGREQFKVNSLKKFLRDYQEASGHTPLQVYMFGDNGENDPRVYYQVLQDADLDLQDSRAFIRQVYSDRPQQVENRRVTYFQTERDLLQAEEIAPHISEQLKRQIQQNP